MRNITLALTLALAGTAQAGPLPNEYATISGASCKIAGTGGPTPTIFQARATGGRNEAASGGVFVLCPLVLTPTPIEGGVITELNLSAYTLDGATHDMTCTAVIGSLVRPMEPTYSAKTFSVTASSTVLTWTGADFGGSAGDGIVGSAWATVTCLVPAQTGIGVVYAKLNPAIR